MLIITSFNIEFNTPEFVVVGMQSDGKSSFIEGLLGFQFNIVESSKFTNYFLKIYFINFSSSSDRYSPPSDSTNGL